MTKQITQAITLTKEQKLLLRLRKTARAYSDKARLLQEDIADQCDHPIVEPYKWEHDNGYGKQSMVEGARCTLCGAISYWGNSRFTRACS